jgi:hypothetical protein
MCPPNTAAHGYKKPSSRRKHFQKEHKQHEAPINGRPCNETNMRDGAPIKGTSNKRTHDLIDTQGRATERNETQTTESEKTREEILRETYPDNELLGNFIEKECQEPGAGKRHIVAAHLGWSAKEAISEGDAALMLGIYELMLGQTVGGRARTAAVFKRMQEREESEWKKVADENAALKEALIDLSTDIVAESHGGTLSAILVNKARETLKKFQVGTRNQASGPSSIRMKIPTSPNDVRCLYNKADRKSLANQLSFVEVKTTESGFAYVSVLQALRLFFAFDLPIDNDVHESADVKPGFDGGVETVWQSQQVRELLEDIEKEELLDPEAIQVGCLEWGDGCAPGGHNMAIRNGAEVISLTFRAPNHLSNNQLYTFPVAVGPTKDGDIEEVRRIIYKELEELRGSTQVVFSMKERKPVKVQLLFYATVMDSPARAEATGNGYSAGSTTMRFGWIGQLNIDKVPSCQDCITARARGHQSRAGRQCNKCCDWKALGTDYKPLDHNQYPDNTLLQYRKGDLKVARELSREIVEDYRNDNIERKVAEARLRNVGLNRNVVSALIENIVEDENGSRSELSPFETIGPAKWFTSQKLSSHILSIMHLLMLGVTKTVALTIKELLSRNREYSHFHRDTKVFLRAAREQYIEWCRIWEYGSTATPFGPHVSTNLLAYCRMFKCVYSYLDEMTNISDKEEVTLAKQVSAAWVAVVARIMQPVYTSRHIDETERYILLFLSLHLDLNKRCMKDGKRTKLETTANLNSLLDLPEVMRRFGPLRMYWEGNWMGEGLLRVMKPLMTQGTHTPTFAAGVLSRFYQMRAVLLLQHHKASPTNDSSEDDNDGQDDFLSEYERYYMNRRYTDLEEVSSLLRDQKPVSCLKLTGDDSVLVQIKGKRGVDKALLYKIELLDSEGELVDSTWFTKLNLLDSLYAPTIAVSVLKTRVETYLYLLPHRATARKGFYYVVNREHKERRGGVSAEFRPCYILPEVFGVEPAMTELAN